MNARWARHGTRLAGLLVIVNGGFPLMWIALTSLKSENELTRRPITYLPQAPGIDNYVEAFSAQPLGRFLFNSFVVSGLSALLAVAVSALAAYAIARMRFRGKALILGLLVMIATLPMISLVVPLFQIMRGAGLLNTHAALILPNAVFNLPICILVLVSFFQSLPLELEDAATMDGASRMQTLWHVIIPLSAPGVATAAILAFVNAWEEFLLALTLISSQSMRTVSVGLTLYQGEFAFPWPLISAALIISFIPIVILVVVFQEKVVSGLTAGAIKG
jgi:multiple sugar transport system permease protein